MQLLIAALIAALVAVLVVIIYLLSCKSSKSEFSPSNDKTVSDSAPGWGKWLATSKKLNYDAPDPAFDWRQGQSLEPRLNPPYMCPDGQVLRKESDDYVCGTFVRSKDKPYPIPVSEYPICPSVYSRIANGKPGEKPKYSCYDAYGIKKDLPSFEISRGFQTSLELFPEFQIDKSKFDPYTTYPLNRLQEEDWEN